MPLKSKSTRVIQNLSDPKDLSLQLATSAHPDQAFSHILANPFSGLEAPSAYGGTFRRRHLFILSALKVEKAVDELAIVLTDRGRL